MFWRVQDFWGNDPRFTPDNFGNQPIWLILQAIEFGQKLTTEKLHHQELGISTLSALFVNANRDPKKGQPAKPADFFYFATGKDSGVRIPSKVADVFFSLSNDGLLPPWVLGIAPIDLLRKCRGNSTPGKPRAWIGDDILLILPRIEDEQVIAPLAITNRATGVCKLTDVDTGTEFYISLPAPQTAWILDAELEWVHA